MILYYDKTGVLKEIINDGSLRQGDYDIDKIYVYVDELDYVSAAVSYLLPDGETFVGPQPFSNRTELQIPFDAKRDLKYFKYYKDYEFLVIPLQADQDDDNLGNGPLDQTGTVHCQISLIMLDGSVKQLGEFNFHVEESPVTNLKYVSTQEWLSLSDYQYLVGQLGAALKSQPNTTTVYSQSATGFTVRSASPVVSGYYPAVSVSVYTVNEPVFVIGGWLNGVIQYGLRVYGDKISYKSVDGSTWTDISYSDIETKSHAGQTYLAKSAGGIAYLQNEYVFEIGGTSSSSVNLGRFTFDAYHENITLESSDGVLLTFNENGFERHYNDMITAVDWDDIETKPHAAATYMTISGAASSLLFINAYQWAYSQVTDGFEIGRNSTNPSGGTIDEYMELKTRATDDTDATDVGLTTLPTLSLSTTLIDNPNYTDEYDISAHINALGITFSQGVEGEYTPTYISFKDIETKSNATTSYLAKSANGVTYTQNSNGSRLSNNYGSLLLYLPSSSAGSSSIFISETGSSNKAYLQSNSIKYTTSAGASWSTVRYSDIAVKSNSLFIEPNSGTVYTQNIQGFTVSGINTASGVPTVRAVVYTVNEPRFFVGLRDQSTQADTYGVYVCPDEIFFRGQGESSYTHLKYAEIGKHVEIGPFTSVSDLASSLFEEDSHDYTIEDMHIYAVKSTTSSVTHMTMVNRRQCVYRIYTTKTPTTSKHVSLYIKVYDDDFALADYDNTTHGDLYAVITM